MPEIAEVETIKNDLIKSKLLGQKVNCSKVLFSKILKISKDDFENFLRNKKILQIIRKGKYLIFSLNQNYFASSQH